MNQIRKLTSEKFRYINKIMHRPQNVLSIPRPKHLPIVGTKLDLISGGLGTRLHEFIDKRHRNLGKIFAENLGTVDFIFISDANLIRTLFINLEGKYPQHILPDPWLLYEKLYGQKRGLLFMDGEEWLQNRRIMNKILLREDADFWIRNLVTKTIKALIDEWKLKGNHTINDISSELYKVSTNVIIQILIGDTTLPRGVRYDELLNIFTDSVKKIFETTTKLYGLPVNWCQKLNLKIWKDFEDSVDISLFLGNKIVHEIIATRKGGDGLVDKLIGEKMDNETISRIIVDFIMAAGDTTAYTTLWTLYLLSENQNVVNDIRSREQIYIPFVIKEAMRLYPVAPFLTRILPQDSNLGPYTIQKGTPIIASIYTSGRNEEYFSEPDQFLPYRWNRHDERRNKLSNHTPYASLPFALGARSCVGRKIAMTQLTELIWQIVDNFDFQCINCDNLQAITSQALIPNKKIELRLNLRAT